ncbi:WecB/TagA/CpsF family glycosyltransferase [Serinibacter arcticus]|uniref:N-acetylmannosaminyltransferase n=1 Tax=Serinibacter arcticus TaxID=1655435 RepID=A0A4Z1E5U1_9MICO|nr:WecB/TagA/CpsF family glycosyltransferase [Serinibacter arcticus]TGO05803.1 N-acetylmannosaminyltransferase [Serinibacter arcticus]
MTDSEARRSSALAPVARVDVLGVNVSIVTVDDLVSFVDSAVAGSFPVVIAAHNLHSVYLARTDSEFARFYQGSDVVVVDGWPVLAGLNRARAASGLAPLPSSHRFGSTDWIDRATALAAVRRVAVIGASSESSSAFVARLLSSPDAPEVLAIPGHPWSADRAAEAVERVSSFEPDLVLVGMGMPLQEQVVTGLIGHLDRGVIATVGGAIDQLSGTQSLAPRWTGRLGVEWLWRLASDPRRLARRYLVEPVQLALVIAKERRAR